MIGKSNAFSGNEFDWIYWSVNFIKSNKEQDRAANGCTLIASRIDFYTVDVSCEWSFLKEILLTAHTIIYVCGVCACRHVGSNLMFAAYIIADK